MRTPSLGWGPKPRLGVIKLRLGVPKPRLGDPKPRLGVPKPRLGLSKLSFWVPKRRLGRGCHVDSLYRVARLKSLKESPVGGPRLADTG